MYSISSNFDESVTFLPRQPLKFYREVEDANGNNIREITPGFQFPKLYQWPELKIHSELYRLAKHEKSLPHKRKWSNIVDDLYNCFKGYCGSFNSIPNLYAFLSVLVNKDEFIGLHDGTSCTGAVSILF